MHTGPVSVPLLARAAPLRVDGVARTLGDAAVIGPARARGVRRDAPMDTGLVSGRPGPAVAALNVAWMRLQLDLRVRRT